MKKKILLPLLVAVMTVGCSIPTTTREETRWEKDDLKGKVKSIRTIAYVMKLISGEMTIAEVDSLERERTNTFFKYDEQGNRTEDSNYYLNGSLLLTRTYKYDDRENRIEKTDYQDGISTPERITARTIEYHK
ncbi:MAG: hypothetical protein LBI60_04235 [Bacteroidales bacterium]|jgi:hypothetical protein|nr:hypothetical protein [Bacteroidales bacterium]